MKKIILCNIVIFIGSLLAMADIWDEIREATLAPNNGSNGRALPLAASWQDGWYKYNWAPGLIREGTYFEPSHIIELIEKQHRVLVNIRHRGPGETNYYTDYLDDALDYLKQKNQPIVIGGTQYEQNLYLKDPYKSLPAASSARVYTTNQELLTKLTPFPPDLSKWYDVGVDWIVNSVGMTTLQTLYPTPPKVIFLSNNESLKLFWTEAETSQRYIDLYGIGQTDNFKRQKFSEGWQNCYAQMFAGMSNSLATAWKNNSIFAGYKNSGPAIFFSRFNSWENYSLHYNNQITWEQNAWDGGSLSYYLFHINPTDYGTDFRVHSPQVGVQNSVFMLEDQLADNPNFWHELSVWTGGEDFSSWLLSEFGQVFNADRFKGMVQFCMFLRTPRVVRYFVGWHISRETDGFEYFDAVMEAVDRVHTDPVLKKFWQYGQLVANTAHQHPYQVSVPAEFASRPRWFQLDTNLDPARPWYLTTEIPVFALARVIGSAPNREWLVYAQSPLQERTGVVITVPGYGNITTDVSVEGTYVHVKENNNDLVAYYSLNNTAADLSGNGNNGILINSPSFDAAKISNGISLTKSSNQYINCGNDTSLDPNGELTVSVWVKADTLEANGYNWLLGKGCLAGGPKSGYSLRCRNKELRFYVVGPNDQTVSVAGPALSEDTWYHITGIFKGGEYLKLIVNGTTYTNTGNIPATIAADSSYDLHIGSGSYCYYYWDGLIDEVKIFNRVLSSEEITAEAHRLLELDFEQISSGTVADISRNGNDGTLVNNPLLTRTRTVGNTGIALNRANIQYVNCGRDASLNGSDELTIDLWAKADTLEASGINWILGKGNLLAPNMCGYSIRCLHKTITFFVVGPNDQRVWINGPALEEDVWYHIVAVFKGGEYVKLIVNDVEYSTTSNIPASIAPSDNYDLQIGDGSYCRYPWDGAVDAVKIYNKALY